MDRNEIVPLLPHGEKMVLIDEVLSWDDESIICRSRSHQRVDNPLRENGRLPGVASVEYGAQAMALHESIILHENRMDGSITALTGVVSALKSVNLSVLSLQSIEEALIIRAKRLMASQRGAIYQFDIFAGSSDVASGRITVSH